MAAAKNTAPKKRPTPEKRDKTNKVRAARNKATKSALKTVLKKEKKPTDILFTLH